MTSYRLWIVPYIPNGSKRKQNTQASARIISRAETPRAGGKVKTFYYSGGFGDKGFYYKSNQH